MMYEILQDFKGSQDGISVEDFKAGEVVYLSEYLAGCINPTWAKIANVRTGNNVEIENKAMITEGKKSSKDK